MTADTLRVAMLVEGAEVPAWLVALAQRLGAAPSVELDVYATGRRGEPPRRPVLLAPYEWIDRRLFRCRPDALRRGRIDVRPAPASFEGRDVVLDFAPGRPEARATGVRFGVWTLEHDLDAGPPPGPVYRLRIEALLADGRRVDVHTSHGAVDSASLHRTRNQALWRAQAAFAHRLETVRRLGDASFEARSQKTKGRVRSSNRTVARHALGAAAGVVGRRIRRFRKHEAWFIATRPRTEARSASLDGFLPLDLPRAAVADPFVLERNSDTYLFFEDDDPVAGKGHISYVRLDGARPATRPATAVEAPYHLSYPFVFEHDGEIFMIPESSANGTVDLYRACPFPDTWKLEHRLLEGLRALDPTLHVDGDRLWLFLTVTEEGAAPNDDLHLYSANALPGPWEPHPANPVVSDARSARPAGRIFRDGDDLIRPSQDCSLRYGYAVVLNRIDVLTETEYRETPVGRIEPSWHPGLLATHTYNVGADVEVIDGKRLVRNRR